MTNEPTSMDFEIDKTVGNEGEYGVKFNEPITTEEKYDTCARCGKPIPKFDGICGDCQLDLLYEQEAFHQRLQEAYEKGEL